MSAVTNVETLAQLSYDELDSRISSAASRMTTRLQRAQDGERDLTPREADLCADDRAELAALKDALESKRRDSEAAERLQLATRASQVQHAIDHTPNPDRVETRALAEFADAIAEGRPIRLAVDHRAITSANAGARGAVALEALGRPNWLYNDAGVPFAVADALTVQGPLYHALVAQTSTAEDTTKPSMADPTPASATLKAFGVTQIVTDQVIRFGVGPVAVTERLASESIFSVNAATATAFVTAAGTPAAHTGTASQSADLAIATVWAATAARPTALLVNPADYPSLSAKASVGPGDTIGAEIIRFNGCPLIVNSSITAGVAIAVNGRAFSAHGTDVLLASLPVLTDNTVILRAETYFALLQHDKGAIAAVALV
jgi:hypothetical protein